MLTKDDLEQIDKLMEKRTVPIEKRQKRHGKKLNLIISYFDRDITRVARKVDRIEKHIGLPASE